MNTTSPLGVVAGALLGVSLLFTSATPTPAQEPVPAFAWDLIIGDREETWLEWPIAIAVADDSEMLVADAKGNRLLLFRDLGATAGWQLAASADLPATPADLIFDGRRYIAALRQEGGLVSIDRESLEITTLSISVDLVPGAMAAHRDGGLFVYDLAGRRVVLLDDRGRLRAEFAVDGWVTGLAAGGGGGFLVSSVAPAEIRRFSPTGELTASVSVAGDSPRRAWPVGLVVSLKGQVLIADRHGGRILVIGSNGRVEAVGARKGWEAGLLRHPADISLFPDGRMAVADLGNGRVQIFHRLESE